jgi:hypothetical protein
MASDKEICYWQLQVLKDLPYIYNPVTREKESNPFKGTGELAILCNWREVERLWDRAFLTYCTIICFVLDAKGCSTDIVAPHAEYRACKLHLLFEEV